MRGMHPEQEQRENEVTPLERHLLAHYQPVLDAASDLFQRLHNGESTEEAIEGALSEAVSYADLEAIVKLADVDPAQRSQLVIQTMIKQLDTVNMSIDRVLEPGDDAMAKAVAAAAGVTETTALDPRSRRLLVFAIMALHQSESVPGISDGWNKLRIPGSLVYRHVETGQWDDAAEAERTGQLHMRSLSNSGYLSVAAPVRPGHPQTHFFFSVNRTVGKQLRQSPEYQRWLEHHRPNEATIKEVAEAAYAVAKPCPTEFVTQPGIKLIAQSDLEKLLKQAKAGSLSTMVKLGYVVSAGSANPEKNRFRRSPQYGKLRRHYFVGQTIDTLTTWKKSADYRTWQNENYLEKTLLQDWQKRLEPHCVVAAEFIPEQYQPAFILSRADVLQSLQGMFHQVYLTHLGYLLMADRADHLLYWPNPANGLAYRAQPDFKEMSYAKRQTQLGQAIAKH